MSDTHGQHEAIGPMRGDVLIHCGDFENAMGESVDLADVDDWFGRQPFDTILCVGGNHDFAAEEREATGEHVFRNAIYLQDQSIEVEGRRFYGAPWVPDLEGWAFYQGEQEIRQKWQLIPPDTDILITHCPPKGTLDTTRRGRSIGCLSLREAVDSLQLTLHCFGHVHARYGRQVVHSTQYCNAALVDSEYKIRNVPLVVEL